MSNKSIKNELKFLLDLLEVCILNMFVNQTYLLIVKLGDKKSVFIPEVPIWN